MHTTPTTPTAEQLAYMNDLKETISRHVNLSATEMLAVTSHFVGVLIALQDEKTVTVDMALDVVKANIEVGNKEAIADLRKTFGGVGD